MQIGRTIRRYREEKKLTQKEMANRLGVTAPAVNKWESGSSTPDIQLLSPIARLLGITVDTLLSFQEELTDQELNHFIKELDHRLQIRDYDDCFQWAKVKISQYPNCYSLLWQTALILDAWRQTKKPLDAARYDADILDWYEDALKSPSEQVRTHCADSLFYFYIRRKDYEKAEACLAYFSEQNPDRKCKQAHLYSLTGRMEEAYRCYEEVLFSSYQLASMVLQHLCALAIQETPPDQAHYLAEKLRQLAKVFDMGIYHEVSPGLELAIKEKDTDTASAIMQTLLDSVDSLNAFQHSPLYQHMHFSPLDPAFVERIREQLAQAFESPELFSSPDA